MKDVYVVSDNLLTPLGETSEENFSQLKKCVSGIRLHNDTSKSPVPFYASIFEKEEYCSDLTYTKFEKLLIKSVSKALEKTEVSLSNKNTILIISTTKGNISLLEDNDFTPELAQKVALSASAKLVADYFKAANKPLIISNACISGVMATVTAKRLLEVGQYENAVVVGSDIITKFILSGFQAFQAVSPSPCKPFDASRNGISLGEGAATIVLSTNSKYSNNIRVSGGAMSNDANHISGPSRTGDGLAFAITNALSDAHLEATDIDFVSAHGTATIFNDEMEANALNLCELQKVPVNSLKPYYGHTLGTAGLLEVIVTKHCLQENTVLPTLGFTEIGVSKPVNVSNELKVIPLSNCLKIASGFGGCNAAVILSKN